MAPYQSGTAAGPFLGNPAFAELNVAIDRVADAHGVTPTGIATEWIARHPASIQTVLGSTTPQRVRDAAAGADVELSRDEWYTLFRAAGYHLP